jgi:hypothetical protein
MPTRTPELAPQLSVKGWRRARCATAAPSEWWHDVFLLPTACAMSHIPFDLSMHHLALLIAHAGVEEPR